MTAQPQTAPTRTEAGDILTDIVVRTFRLNGQLLAAAERIARPARLTAAWWQVLGAALREPAPVAGIARAIGAGAAERPAHRRPTGRAWPGGLRAQPGAPPRQAAAAHRRRLGSDRGAAARAAPWANRVSAGLDAAQLRQALEVLDRLIEATATTPKRR